MGRKFAKMALLVVMFLLMEVTNNNVFAQKEELTKMLVRVKPGVVLIYGTVAADVTVNTTEGPKKLEVEPIACTGSGFIVNPRGYIVTNGHVVQLYYEKNEDQLQDLFLRKIILKYFLSPKDTNAPDVELKVNRLVNRLKSKTQIIIKKNLFVILSNGRAYPAEIKAYSPPIEPMTGKLTIPGFHYQAESGKDISVLKIEERNLPVVELGDSDMVQLGDPVYIVGYPGVVLTHPYLGKQTVLEATVTSGRISGVKVDVKGMPVIQTDAPVTWGNSGGPAFDIEGKVIGVATFISIKQGQAIQGFNFLVPVNTVKEFVRAAGVPMGEQSLFNKLWTEALDLYYHGKLKAALNKLEEVNRLQRDIPDVIKLMRKIQELLPEQSQRTPVIVSVLIGGGVVILIILAVFGIGKFRKSRKEAGIAVRKDTGSTTGVKTEVSSQAQAIGVLICESGPLAGKSFRIDPTGLKIGRDPSKNNVVIQDNKVSREHAWIGFDGDELVVKDLGSTNGTFVNSLDNKVTRYPLKDGDLIIIGKGSFATFRFKKT